MYPALRQTVLDTTDVHELAEFYRELLGWQYRPSGEELDPDTDWLVLVDPAGGEAAGVPEW
jgi:catechol-2,3-dioxygenase